MKILMTLPLLALLSSAAFAAGGSDIGSSTTGAKGACRILIRQGNEALRPLLTERGYEVIGESQLKQKMDEYVRENGYIYYDSKHNAHKATSYDQLVNETVGHPGVVANTGLIAEDVRTSYGFLDIEELLYRAKGADLWAGTTLRVMDIGVDKSGTRRRLVFEKTIAYTPQKKAELQKNFKLYLTNLDKVFNSSKTGFQNNPAYDRLESRKADTDEATKLSLLPTCAEVRKGMKWGSYAPVELR